MMVDYSGSLIIIPTYNEKDNIFPLIHKIQEYASGVHILFVDDQSPDGTLDIIKKARKTLLPNQIHYIERHRKMGLATAYIDGMLWALERKFEIFVQMDADLSHDPCYLPSILQSFDEGYDGVIGSRYIKGGGTLNWTRKRKILSALGNIYAQKMLTMPYCDITGGYNAWHRRIFKDRFLDKIKSRGYVFQVEVKLRALQQGAKIKEVPIIFKERYSGRSKINFDIITHIPHHLSQFF